MSIAAALGRVVTFNDTGSRSLAAVIVRAIDDDTADLAVLSDGDTLVGGAIPAHSPVLLRTIARGTVSGTWKDNASLSGDGGVLGAAGVALTLGGDVISPAQLTTSQNDWAPTGFSTAQWVRYDANSGAVAITGFAAPFPAARRMFLLSWTNATSTCVIKHQDAGSAAANRVITPNGSDYAPSACWIVYDTTLSRWVVISHVG